MLYTKYDNPVANAAPIMLKRIINRILRAPLLAVVIMFSTDSLKGNPVWASMFPKTMDLELSIIDMHNMHKTAIPDK